MIDFRRRVKITLWKLVVLILVLVFGLVGLVEQLPTNYRKNIAGLFWPAVASLVFKTDPPPEPVDPVDRQTRLYQTPIPLPATYGMARDRLDHSRGWPH